MNAGRRITDAEPPGEFEFQRTVAPYPCEQHAEWLKTLDERLWAMLFAVCGGSLASVITLIIILSRTR